MQMSAYIDGFVQDNKVPDVIIVDENGEQTASLRHEHPATPIILLTSEHKEKADNLNSLIYKPFSLWKLIDAVVAANNKLDNSDEGILLFNQYELQPTARLIIDKETDLQTKLTEKEVDILKYLYKMQNEFVSKLDLQTNVWQYHEEVTTHTVETHIYRLRQKVEKNAERRLILVDNGCYKLNMGDLCRN